MDKFILITSARLLALCLTLLCGPALAGQWKPICVEGSSCNAPYQVYATGGPGGFIIDLYAVGPLVTSEGILLHHTPHGYQITNQSDRSVRHIFRLSPSGVEDFGDGFHYVSDVNATHLPSGKTMSFWLGGGKAWFDPGDGSETFEWAHWLYTLNAALTGPPVYINGATYIGIHGPGFASIYKSTDEGVKWIRKTSAVAIGFDRFNLLENPEHDALWAIKSESFEFPGSLWESTNDGATWTQVDDGSFPADTVRVVHDPENTQISYALGRTGLFVSFNRGVSWQPTSLADPVHGLVFVEQKAPLTRAIVVGTDTGVKVSVDETTSWPDMSKGLIETPHTVTYGHGILIATSDAGYFTCNSVDCAGLGQSLPPEEERGIVEVVEFYNTDLDHYFVTALEWEADGIDNGFAGPGWIRTGESFLAWGLGSNVEAANGCRFYGSVDPGPNSHFFTISTQECGFLLHLQEIQPSTKPRWNFEGYAFSLMPSRQDQEQPCSENLVPVYRAYNNGYSQGKDSNHRYVTNPGLLIPLVEEGWSDEGVVFCSPASN